MATTNVTESGTQTNTFQRLLCSPLWVGDSKQQSLSFLTINIFLSITATLGNCIILVALHKESSLHPPSKLLYRCLATTDLLVGLVTQPLYATYWISVVHEHWSLCRYARDASYISSYALCGVFVNDDGYKRGPTSRHVVGTEIQRDCNFEAHAYHFSHRLGCMCNRWFIHTSQLPYKPLV